MAEKTQSINLLPNKGENVLDQFLGWALTIGRLLIILTETLALSVFFYRFSLDMKISDLHDQIKNQRAIVMQFKSTEDTARDLQKRLKIANKADLTGGVPTAVFAQIIDLGRGKVTFKNISVGTDGIKLEVQSSSSSTLKNFVTSLKNYSGIDSVTVNGVENKTSSATILLTLSAKIQQK